MAAVLSVLETALRTGSRRMRRILLWAVLPAIQALWANVQVLFMIGPVLVALALAAEALRFLRRPVPRDAPDRTVDLLVCLALGTLASLLNPYGAAALRLPFEQLFGHLGGESLVSRTIVEFRPPLSGHLVTPSIVAFVALLALTALALLLNAGGARALDLLVAGATLYLALKARRNIPLFAVAALPILLRNGAAAVAAFGLLRRTGWPLRLTWGPLREAGAGRARRAVLVPALVTGLGIFLVVDVASNRFYLVQPTERWWGEGEIPYYFPDEAARFVDGANLPGQVFHSLSAGGFLIHAWGGARGVFIDGRNDPYLDGILKTYLEAIADPAAFEEAVRRYQITAVLWPHNRALEARPLLAYLARGQGWVLIHLDPGASVYLRADVPLLRLLGAGPFAGGRSRAEIYDDLARRLEEKPFDGPPIREIALGQFFSVSGDPQGAELFLGRALRRLPRSATLLHDYALSLERQGRLKEARAAHQAAVDADPGFLPSVGALGALLVDEGRVQEGEPLLERAYGGGERGLQVIAARARLFDRQGRTRDAVEAYKEALRLAPQNPLLLGELARFYGRHGEAGAGLPLYAAAAAADPDNAALAADMASLLEGLGRVSAALDVARDGARRAAIRLQGPQAGGGWVGAGGGPPASGPGGLDARAQERRLMLLAARLEMRSGNEARAREWIAVLARAGLLGPGDLEDDPVLRALGREPPSGPGRPPIRPR